jgi:hypothetical protein
MNIARLLGITKKRRPPADYCCGRQMKRCSVHKWECHLCGSVKKIVDGKVKWPEKRR